MKLLHFTFSHNRRARIQPSPPKKQQQKGGEGGRGQYGKVQDVGTTCLLKNYVG